MQDLDFVVDKTDTIEIEHVYGIKIKLFVDEHNKINEAIKLVLWFGTKTSKLVGATINHTYELYTLKDFRQNDQLDMYMSKFIHFKLIDQTNTRSKWKFKKISTKGKTSFH